MKKLVLVIFSLLLLVTPLLASDIDVNEPQPALTKWRLDTIRILAFTETAEIYYRKGWMDGDNFIGTNQGEQILFINIPDNPDTPSIDELDPQFNQFISYIQTRIAAGDTLKQAVTKAVKIRLGI